MATANPDRDAASASRAISAGTPIAIDVRRASKRFTSGLQALEAIDLQIRGGDFATLIGPSGSGKSTLLRMIAGLSEPSAGSVALWPGTTDAAQSATPSSPTRSRRSAAASANSRRLAYVFQSPTLMPWASVEHNVRLPLALDGLDRGEMDARVANALQLVGLREFAALHPRQLSGGMQMRVSIARALVTAPDLLLMDEPFGALDEITRGRLDLEVRELWATKALTVLFVTHNIYEAVFLSTRVLVLSQRPGRIIGEVVVDEPHPRQEAFRLSTRYMQWCKQLSDLLARAIQDTAPSLAQGMR
ncbi:MAG: ABC transporter ATP-binding protein [Betaproteobacteria bacterium]